MNIVRVSGANVWRLRQLERTPQASPWAATAEHFLLDGRAMGYLRDPATIMLAVDIGVIAGVGIVYADPDYEQTMRLGAVMVDHRQRGQNLCRPLVEALIAAAFENAMYLTWLTHRDNEVMLHVSRTSGPIDETKPDEDGYIQFFAERKLPTAAR